MKGNAKDRTILKDRLGKGSECLLGAFLGLPSPALAEMLGLAGFDFVILDTEHGVFDSPGLEECVRAAAAADLPCMVRIGKLDAALIQSALDVGADGVQVPQSECAEDAIRAVRYSHFPPLGERGFGSTTRSGGYGFYTRAEILVRAKEKTLVCIQIESRTAVENLTSILQVPGIDVVFIGTSDLSLSYGYDSPNHPKLQSLVDELVPTIVAAGKTAGIFLNDWAQLGHLQELGVRYVAVSAGVLIKQALNESTNKFAASNKQLPQL
jgi:4-hydroxy-2-oxoheptanedioate aldolase